MKSANRIVLGVVVQPAPRSNVDCSMKVVKDTCGEVEESKVVFVQLSNNRCVECNRTVAVNTSTIAILTWRRFYCCKTQRGKQLR